jgi:hypothetical protein
MKELEQASWYRHFFRILLFRKYRDLYGPILQLTLDGHNPVIPGVERWWILYKHIYLAIPYKDRKAIRLRMASGLGLEATIDQYLRIDVDKFIDSWKIRDASDMWGSALRMTAGADEYDEIMAMQDSL